MKKPKKTTKKPVAKNRRNKQTKKSVAKKTKKTAKKIVAKNIRNKKTKKSVAKKTKKTTKKIVAKNIRNKKTKKSVAKKTKKTTKKINTQNLRNKQNADTMKMVAGGLICVGIGIGLVGLTAIVGPATTVALVKKTATILVTV